MKPSDGSSNQPLWTEEFSVHASEDSYVLRRQFLKFLVLTSFGMLAGNGVIWIKTLLHASGAELPEAGLGASSDLQAGGVKLFNYPTPNDPVILVRRRDGTLAAFSQKCTHLSCAVYYSAEHDRLECPCHEGYFSVEDGRVLQGPPPRPLPRVRLVERDGQLFATGIEVEGEAG
jgi:Rieske Fe-S protein